MLKLFSKTRMTFTKLIPIILLFVLVNSNYAQNNNIKTIEYQSQSLRELADKYLGNPDYWETILQFNNLETASELKIGMQLEIPTGLVSSTLKKMDETKNKISDANSNGAKVLTPELITEAEMNFSKVLVLRRQGEWEEDKRGNGKMGNEWPLGCVCWFCRWC